ncbi:DgyrCDS8969 [Dimorphilus gyrociliatus]|uniref:DgyrCDS8969 n=1 Tax=Dimorphilus gyrociliatus TaxID=2664684 RepID=A0A7I8VWY4_9ANNE|nr:DgyrCDS8969 [Dimorphilus gyrociliatus]
MSGFNFGSASTSGFNFGASASKPASTQPGFSFPSTTKSSVSFGQTTTLGQNTTQAGASGFNLGTGTNTTTSSSTFSFGNNTLPSKPTGLTLPQVSTSATANTTSLPTFTSGGTGFNFGAKTTAPALGGIATISTTTGTASNTTGSFNFGGLTNTSSPFSNNTTIASKGLGGVDAATAQANEKQSAKAAKDANIPKEILQTVEEFKKFLNNEKKFREEISRHSTKASVNVVKEVNSLKQQAALESSKVERNKIMIECLKQDIRSEFRNAEMAKHTRDIPETLQYENIAPGLYFETLIENYEHSMVIFKQQIDDLERHLMSTTEQIAPLTAQDLSDVMKQLHSSFICLAANLQSVHDNVQSLKEQFLSYLKLYKNDNRNVFDKKTAPAPKPIVPPTTIIPSNSISSPAAAAVAAVLSRVQPPFNSSSLSG